MKKLVLVIIFLHIQFYTFSQQLLGCGREPSVDEYVDESIYSHAVNRTPQDTTKFVFNVFFHIIRNDDGDSVPTNENTTLEAVAMLNRVYNQFDIFLNISVLII